MSVDGDLRRIFRENLRDAHWVTIETGFVTQGVPDSEACFKGGVTCWIEYKKTHGNSVGHMKPEQIGWLEKRCRHGGRAFVAVRKICEGNSRRVSCDELHLIHGTGARYLKTDGISGVPKNLLLGSWSGGPSRWDWKSVRALLIMENH